MASQVSRNGVREHWSTVNRKQASTLIQSVNCVLSVQVKYWKWITPSSSYIIIIHKQNEKYSYLCANPHGNRVSNLS